MPWSHCRPAPTRRPTDALAAFVAVRLAGYEKPRRIALVREVQRLSTGKADLRWAGARFPAAVTR